MNIHTHTHTHKHTHTHLTQIPFRPPNLKKSTKLSHQSHNIFYKFNDVTVQVKKNISFDDSKNYLRIDKPKNVKINAIRTLKLTN